MIGQHLIGNVAEGGKLSSFIRMLYLAAGFVTDGPPLNATLDLLAVSTETGQFEKLRDLLKDLSRNSVGVQAMPNNYSLGVMCDGDRDDLLFDRKSWCALLPATEVEVLSPSTGEWGSYASLLPQLPAYTEDTHYVAQIGNAHSDILLITGKRQECAGFASHHFYKGQWRFRKQGDEPVVYLPETEGEQLDYVRLFF